MHHPLRPAHVVLSVLGTLLLLFFLTVASAVWQVRELGQNAALVRELGLSDLVLSSETRYTRHPSQADYHSAFQDHPTALEHFPSGALLLPHRPNE